MLDRPLFDEWLKRLRSGDYRQGKNYLCRITSTGERRYCCLGVLAEIMVEADLMQRVPGEGEVFYRMGRPDEDASVYLPPELIHMDVQQRLAVANDGDNLDFPGIAKLIEGELADDLLRSPDWNDARVNPEVMGR